MSNLKGSYDDSYLLPTTKKERLQAHQRDAYYDVIHAFAAETLAISTERSMIMKDLRKEWNISTQTHYIVENRVKDEPLIQHYLSKVENPSIAECLSEDPESLVEEWIKIRLPDEDEFITFYVDKYNETEGTHQLVSPFSLMTGNEDPCDWIDIRLFPEEDIAWGEEPPDSPEPRRRRSLYEEALLNAARKAEAQANVVVIA